jgi:hypothetical protein
MKGDVVEICLAALRGHEAFRHHAALELQLQADGLKLPKVFQHMCDLCALVQQLDACLVTGFLKKTGDRVTKITRKPPFKNMPFAVLWNDHRNKAYCLSALLAMP